MATSRDLNLSKKEEELIRLYRQDRGDLINFLLGEVFFAVTTKDLWKVVQGGAVEVNGVVIAKQDFKPFSKQAESFLESPLWDQTKKMLELSAINKGIKKSTHIDELVFAKSMIYNLDKIEEFLKNISRL